MRTFVIGPALGLAVLFLLAPLSASAQSSDKPAPTLPGSEQVLRDIFNEVHLLRLEIARTSATTYRSQVLLSRIKVEQDQIARLSRELNEVQDRLATIKAEQTAKRGRLASLTKQKDVGMVGPEEVNVVTQDVQELEQREQTCLLRVSQISSELDSSRNKLAELDARLDMIEREMIAPAADNDAKPAKRP